MLERSKTIFAFLISGEYEYKSVKKKDIGLRACE